MDTEGAVRETIREHNREIVVEAIACAMAGVFGTLVTLAVVGFVALRGNSPTVAGWLKSTLVVCGVLFLIGAVSAWRRGGTKRATQDADEWASTIAEYPTPYYIAADLTAMGFVWWAIHGPYTFVESWSMLRSRLPVDEATVAAATRLLRELGEEVSVAVSKVVPPRVAFVLLQAGLAKPDRVNPRPPSVVITEKGRDACSGCSTVGAGDL